MYVCKKTALKFIRNSTNGSTIIINIYKNYYAPTCFDTKCVILRGLALLNKYNFSSARAANVLM